MLHISGSKTAMVYYRQRRMPSGLGMLPPTPPGIKKLLWINAGIWFLFALAHAAGFRPLTAVFRWLSLTPGDVIRGAVWQPLTYMFLHDPSGLWHVGLNLFALWMFGGTLERDWGTRRFLNFYLLCGVGAGLADVVLRLLMGTSAVATIGASGAVLAVVAAFAVMYPHTPILISFILPVPRLDRRGGLRRNQPVGRGQRFFPRGQPEQHRLHRPPGRHGAGLVLRALPPQAAGYRLAIDVQAVAAAPLAQEVRSLYEETGLLGERRTLGPLRRLLAPAGAKRERSGKPLKPSSG